MPMADPLIAELTHEAAATRQVLERVPEDKLSWKPHPKSMTLGQLAMHVAAIPGAIANLLREPRIELPQVSRPAATSRADLLAALDNSVTVATAALGSWGDDGLQATWELTRQGKTALSMPRIRAVRAIMLNHWYHHRGQLTVYLRLLDVPLPAVYGDSADTPGPIS